MHELIVCKCKDCKRFVEPIIEEEQKVVKVTIYNVSDIISYNYLSCFCPYCKQPVYSPTIRLENLSRRSQALDKVRNREIEIRLVRPLDEIE